MTGRGASPFSAFDFEGPALISYLVFAVVIGAAASVAFRRSLPAMFVSLVVFVAVRVFVELQLRPNFLPALSRVNADHPQAPLPLDIWDLGVRYTNAAGTEVSTERVNTLILNFHGAVADQFHGNMTTSYFQANDVFLVSVYQPADRYWLFQSIEAAIFIALSLLLVLLTLWLVRKRA